ncbi:hypothetical protein [Tardiphaga sp. 367_B4_N1_1]|uniref:hypothetical protein n=1 Tax=Tardiphaga sp. 367_B4_N1_1 TaxID=3240777 RepID=UPI003F1F99E2
MARATNVYLFAWQDYDGLDVRAAFTVKHELVSYLRKQPMEALVGCTVMRMPDGGTGSGVELDIKELLA